MAGLVERMVNAYNSVMVDMRDPRIDGYPLMSSPFPVAAICLTYTWVVWWAGPRWMKNRPPYNVQRILVVYNALQVVFSLFLFFWMLKGGWLFHYSYRCQPVDYSNDPRAVYMVSTCWWYFISKFAEFPDTFFFIMRKKFQHVSPLHVIHHGIMPFSVWWGARFIPGGHSTFFGFANTFVHIFMYTYYMLAAMGPRYRRFIWWKKHMTTLQMIQFVAIMTHSFQLVFRNDCDYPTVASWYIGGHGVLFFILFFSFYKKEYHSQKPKKDDDAVAVSNGADGYSNGIKTNGVVPATNGTAKTANGTLKTANGHQNGDGVHHRGATSNGVIAH